MNLDDNDDNPVSSVPDWISGPLWPGVSVRTTTRAWGVGLPPFDRGNVGTHVGDDPAAVSHNRQVLSQALPDEPLWLDQVHGTSLLNADDPRTQAGMTADGSFSCRSGRVLAIMTADCLPVVLAESSGKGVLVMHAGWRGLADGILQQGVKTLSRTLAMPASAFEAWLGPAIGAAAYQVGNEVRSALGWAGEAHATPDAHEPGKWRLHLAGAASDLLRQAGVARVHDSALCTYEDPHWFSYRRDGRTGRFVTLAWLNPPSPGNRASFLPVSP